EGFSAFLAGLPLREVLDYRSMDPHPPLHAWSLHFWTAVAGDSETALRFPSALAGTLAVVLTWRLAAALLGRRAALLAGLLAAVRAGGAGGGRRAIRALGVPQPGRAHRV